MTQVEPPEEESSEELERLQTKLQLQIFDVAFHLLQNAATFGSWVFYLLGVLEFLQLLWFSFHSRMTFQDQSLGVSTLKTGTCWSYSAMSYLNVGALLDAYPSGKTATIIIAFVVTVVYISSFALLRHVLTLPKPNIRATRLVLICVNTMVLLYNGLLVMPLTEIIGRVLYCDSSSTTDLECYDATYTLLCVLATLIMLTMFVSLAFFTFLYYLRNPFNRCFLSKNSNLAVLLRAGIKISGCIYFIVDTSSSYLNVYIYGYVALLIGYIFFFRIDNSNYFKLQFEYFQLCCEVTLVVFSLVTIMQFYLSQQGVPELTLVYGSLCAALACYCIVAWRKSSFKLDYESTMEDINSAAYESLIRYVLQVIEDAREQHQFVKLLAIAKMHHERICVSEAVEECGCSTYLSDMKTQKWRDDPDLNLDQSYKYLDYLLEEASSEYTHNSYFKLTHALLLYYRFGCKVKGVLISNELQEQKPSFRERFELHNLKKQFKAEADWQEVFYNNTYAQSNNYLTFSQHFQELEDHIEMCMCNSLEFWSELLQDSPSLLRLSSLSGKVRSSKAEIEESFNGCNNIFAFAIHPTSLYASYLIASNPSQEGYKRAEEILSKVKATEKEEANEFNLSHPQKDMCLITVGGTRGVVGNIINCSSEIKEMLGYERKDVVGQSIYKMMPKAYHEMHDTFLKKFISVPDKQLSQKNHKLSTLVLDSRGFVKMCLQLVRIMPSVEHGFKFISFCEVKNEEVDGMRTNYILYSQPSMEIQAISEVEVLNGSHARLPEVLMQTNINIMFPRTDFCMLDETLQDGVINSRVFSSGITRDQVEMLNFSDDYDSAIEVKLMLDRTIPFNNTKLHRIKFFALDDLENKKNSRRKQCLKWSNNKYQKELEKVRGKIAEQHATPAEQFLEGRVMKLLEESRLPRLLKALFGVVLTVYLITVVNIVIHTKYSLDVSIVYSSGFSRFNTTSALDIVSGEIALNNLLLTHSEVLNISADEVASFVAALSDASARLDAILQRIYAFSQDDFFMNDKLSIPSGDFKTQEGIEKVSLPDAGSRLVYAGTIITSQPTTEFADYPALNPVLLKQVLTINENCPERFPVLARQLTRQLLFILQVKPATLTRTSDILFFELLSLQFLGIVVMIVLSWRVLQRNRQLLQVFNYLQLDSVTDLKEDCQAYIASQFSQHNTGKVTQRKMLSSPLALSDDPILIESDEQARLAAIAERKNIKPLAIHSLANKFCLFSGVLIVVTLFALPKLLDSLLLDPFGEYFTSLQKLAEVKRHNMYSALFAEQCFVTGSQYYCSLFKSQSSRLYSTVEEYYASATDTQMNRAVIYGQIEKLKTLLAMNTTTQQDIIRPVELVLGAQANFHNETNLIMAETNNYIQTTLAVMIKVEGIGSVILLLVSYYVVNRLLLRRLQRRCRSTQNIVAMFPVQLFRVDACLVALIDKHAPPPKQKK